MASKNKKQPAEAAHMFTKKELVAPVETAAVIDEAKIDEQITEIYENDDGSMPDMKHFQMRRRRRLVTALSVFAGACFFLAGVMWLGFFVLQPTAGFQADEVALSIAGDSQAAIGQKVRYRIRYRNAESVDLNQASLQVRYPEGFVLLDTSAPTVNEARDEWKLGTLTAGASGLIDLEGRLYGTVGEAQSLRAFLNYTPVNFNSDFQQVATLNTALTAAPVEVVVEGPESVVAGGDATIEVKLAPTGEDGIENLAVEVDGGGVFAIKPEGSAKPDKFFTNRWSLPVLFGPAEIKVHGVVTPTTTEPVGTITVRLLGWKDDKRTASPYVYQIATHTLALLQTDLAAQLVINGSAGDFSVQPGEVLNGSVILRNAGGTPLKQVAARVIFDAPSFKRQSLLNWAELNDESGGAVTGEQLSAERRRGFITWDRRHILDLRQLDPKEEIIIDFGLPIKSAGETDLADFPNGAIEATLEVQYEVDGKKETFSTTPLRLTVNSDTTLEVRDTVSEVFGHEWHKLKWVITNTFHELENIKVEADFYGDVAFTTTTESVPAGVINYEAEKKKLVWTIDKVPVGVDVLALSFALELKSINPTQTNLTSKVRFEATDTITGQKILKVGDEILLARDEETGLPALPAQAGQAAN